MSEHDYITTASNFSHGVANASGDYTGGGQNAGNLAKLDGLSEFKRVLYAFQTCHS